MTQSTELRDNPLLVAEGLPPFDRIRPEHVVPAVRHVLADAEGKLRYLEADVKPTWDGLLRPLEVLDRQFEYAWGPVGHLFGVKNSPELREAYEQVLPEVVAFGLRARQSRPVYESLKEIKAGVEWRTLDEPQRRIIDAKIRDAELAGIGLQGAERERFNEIAKELSRLSTDFANHVLDATKAFGLDLKTKEEVAGLPASLLQLAAHAYNEHVRSQAASKDELESSPAAASGAAVSDLPSPSGRGAGGEGPATAETGPWRITLEGPCVVPFLQHSRRRDLRERVYRAFVTRAADGEFDNSPLIPQILKLRREQAQLLGFRTFAEMSLQKKMAPDIAAVEAMLETLRAASWDPAMKDMRDLEQLAAGNDFHQPIAHWDVAFWAERLREERYDYTDEQVRPYFPLERVLDGLFRICGHLFGIAVERADGEAPIWHQDVRFFKVFGENGEQIAAFYLDPYSRPENKRGGAWMDDCFGRRRIDDRLRLPVAHLVCNSTPPIGETPSLMTFREVETLFHEFGHGLQHMLTTVDYADAAGISGVEWDAVELASQFMENWCYHRPTLLGISGHYQTGEPLPDDLFQKICAARTFRAGSQMLRQLTFGLTDIALHHGYDPDGGETVFDVQRRISEKTSVLPMLAEDRFLCSFQHIFSGGYAAGYYSYKWAEVLSADAFSAFEEAGLDNDQAVATIGRRFRDTVLALGGGRHPMEVFKDFRGREPSPEALLRQNGLV